jgi:RNA polymerase sigma-70 factor (ECF subfamily)
MDFYKTYSSEQLVALLRQDDRPAFKELYDRFAISLLNKAYNFLRQEYIARDCVQEVFLWLWQHRNTVQIQNVNNYLHQAVRFQALKSIKEQRAVVNLDERLDQVTQTILQDDGLQHKELKSILAAMIASLPPDQQEMFLLNREEGLTYKQIAALKKVSVKTVEKKISQALKQLRPGLDEAFLLFVFVSSLR